MLSQCSWNQKKNYIYKQECIIICNGDWPDKKPNKKESANQLSEHPILPLKVEHISLAFYIINESRGMLVDFSHEI